MFFFFLRLTGKSSKWMFSLYERKHFQPELSDFAFILGPIHAGKKSIMQIQKYKRETRRWKRTKMSEKKKSTVSSTDLDQGS
jgi:hypothetical protein